MQPVEDKIAKVSRRGSGRMIPNKCQMRQDAGRHFRRKTQMTHVHVGDVVFGDQLICRRPFVKRFALRYLSDCPVCLSVTLVYCGQTVGL